MSTNENMAKEPFAFLASHQFIVLTTYRKDGTAVPTTVWFVYDQGKIYITTGKVASKMKRIRNNGCVRMAPSDRVGNLLGESEVQGLAHEATSGEHAYVRSMLAQKYGEMFERMIGSMSTDRTYIIVEPVPQA